MGRLSLLLVLWLAGVTVAALRAEDSGEEAGPPRVELASLEGEVQGVEDWIHGYRFETPGDWRLLAGAGEAVVATE